MERHTAVLERAGPGGGSLDEEVKHVLRYPELSARSFLSEEAPVESPDKPQESELYDLQAEKIEDLRGQRAKLLDELDVSESLKALDNPALFLQEAIGGFERKCRDRQVVRSHGDKDSARFATIRHDMNGNPAIDLDMHIQFGRGEDGPRAEFYNVTAEFQESGHEHPVGYVFTTDGEDYSVQERYWAGGEWRFREVDDKVRRFALVQALVADMLVAESALDPGDKDDNQTAVKLIKKDLEVARV